MAAREELISEHAGLPQQLFSLLDELFAAAGCRARVREHFRQFRVVSEALVQGRV